MNWEQTLLVSHIILAAIWFGGGFSVAIVALRSQLSGDTDKFCRVGSEVEWFGSRILMPCAVLVFITGVALTPLVASFDELWIIISLAAFALSAILALVFLGPNPGVLARLIEEHGPKSDVALARIRRHFLYNRIEIVILLVVLIDMILKPGR